MRTIKFFLLIISMLTIFLLFNISGNIDLNLMSKSLESKPVLVLIVYVCIISGSIYLIKRYKKEYCKIPVKQIIGKLEKTIDYIGNPSEEYSEYRQSYTVAKYIYYIDQKRYSIKIKGSYGGSFKDEITLYYRKGRRDISTDKKVSLPYITKLLFLVYLVIICPLMTGLICLFLNHMI